LENVVELEKRSRVTDAPEIDKTTLRAHFPPTEQRPDSRRVRDAIEAEVQ